MPALDNASATPAPAPQFPSPFADVLAGSVPAVSLAPLHGSKTDPAQEFVVSNFEELTNAGLDYHETPDNHSVLFNPKVISADQIDKADKAGELFRLAPLVKDLAQPGAETAPEAAPQGQAPAAAPAPAGPLAGMQVTDPKIKTARLKNLAPAPTNQPNPVPGQLAKRAI